MKSINMLEGSIKKSILIYTIPLIIGNFFQLLYSTVDMAVISRCSGQIGIDAVGASTPIINIVSFLIIGLCNGASILMSEFYGKKDTSTLKKEIGMCLSLISIISIFLSLFCIINSSNILNMTKVNPQIFVEARTYLVTSMIGIIFLGIYNVYFASLRSIGDSKNPLIFLVISCLFNIIFDLIFAYALNMGVFGVALSTVLSQGLSMIICIFYAKRKNSIFSFVISDFKIRKDLLFKTSGYALASAMQQIVLHIGKAFIQSEINTLSLADQAGFTIGTKIDEYAITPAQCIGNSISIFIAQNKGANNTKRAKKGFLFGLVFGTSFSIFMSILIFSLRVPLINIFNNENDLTSALTYTSFMCMIYFLPGFTNIVQGYFRGIGKLKIVFSASFLQIIIRVITAYIIIPKLFVKGAAICTMIGWISMLIFEIPILIYHYKKNINFTQD